MYCFLAILFAQYCLGQVNWIPMNGPEVISMTCCQASDDGIVYAGTWRNGILKSTDRGIHWEGETRRATGRSILALAVVDRKFVYAVGGHGVFDLSTDGGATWNAVRHQYTPPTDVFLLDAGVVAAPDFTDGLIWIGGPGRQWSFTPFPPAAADTNARKWFQFQSDRHGTIYATSFMSDLYEYRRGGRTWRRIGRDFRRVSAPRLAISPGGEVCFFAREGLWRLDRLSGDWVHWKVFDGGVRCVAFSCGKDIAVSTDAPAVFISHDAGSSWNRSPWSAQTAWVAAFADSQTLVAGTAGEEVYRSPDAGGSWERVHAGLVRTTVRSLVILPPGTLVAVLQDLPGIYRSTDNGARWSCIRLDEFNRMNLTSVYRAAGDVVIASTLGSGIYRSRDGGATWIRTMVTSNDVAMCDGTDRGYVAAATDDGVFSSCDTGATWTRAGLGGKGVYAISVRENLLVASVADVGIMRSGDRGVTWAQTFNFAPNWICPAPGLMAGASWGKFFRSTDDGRSWSATTIDSGKPNLLAMAVDPSGGIWLTSAGLGLYHSTDSGVSWTNHRAGLPTTVSRVYAVNKNLDYLTGDPSRRYSGVRDDEHPRALPLLIADARGKWYLSVEEGGIYTGSALAGVGKPVKSVPSNAPLPGPPPGARIIPGYFDPVRMHDVVPASSGIALIFHIHNKVAGITSDKLAVMHMPTGADKPPRDRQPAITVMPLVREFVRPDAGESRDVSFTLDIPGVMPVGGQDTLTFLLVSRVGAVHIKRVAFRYVAPGGGMQGGAVLGQTVITEEMTIEKR